MRTAAAGGPNPDAPGGKVTAARDVMRIVAFRNQGIARDMKISLYKNL
jgi:hypothetical protein